MSPTRELAIQLDLVLKKFLSHLPKHCSQLRVALLMGGANMNMEMRLLKQGMFIS